MAATKLLRMKEWHDWRIRDAAATGSNNRLEVKAGFAAAPEGFRINRYEINRDHWEDGYVTGEGEE